MGIVTQNDRNRLAALLLAIRPPHSFAAKFEALSDEQRAHHDRWQIRHHRWIEKIKAQCPDDYESPDAWLYERTLEREHCEPKLRRAVEIALYGNMPRILNTDTDDDAARELMEIIQS